jgi:hypothetical protein
MIKVNQITNTAQAARLASKIDVGGICVTRQPTSQAPYIGETEARVLVEAMPELKLSVAFHSEDCYSIAEMARCLTELRATYFEYTPVDFAKQQQFEDQLRFLDVIKYPRIANGFFIQRDDCGFIQEPAPFQRMRDAGVEMFQFEVNSAVDASFKLQKRDLSAANAFFQRFPTLVSDAFSNLRSYPLTEVRGYFFNIATATAARNYDYSLLGRPESEILRVLLKR